MESIDVVIEIPKNSRIKYEKDEHTGKIRCDRYLKTPFNYPYNYGYIPNTLAPDNDPLDVFVLMEDSLYPGTIISVEIIGVLKMIDNGEEDDKLIAIPSKKLNFPKKFTNQHNELYINYVDEIKFFLKNYKKLENKVVEVNEYLKKIEAIKIINHCLLK
tara:strand:- start:3405 stop:3881 length:477 start_codon:yes stop_codon:yes gene_type:complete